MEQDGHVVGELDTLASVKRVGNYFIGPNKRELGLPALGASENDPDSALPLPYRHRTMMPPVCDSLPVAANMDEQHYRPPRFQSWCYYEVWRY